MAAAKMETELYHGRIFPVILAGLIAIEVCMHTINFDYAIPAILYNMMIVRSQEVLCRV
jgi:hypothetical protein